MSSSIIMSHSLISYIAILLYLTCGSLIALRLFYRDKPHLPGLTPTLTVGFAGLILHTWLIYDAIFSQPGLNLAFFNALALASWTVVALLLASSQTKPVENLGILILPVAALTLFLEVRYTSQGFMREATGWPIKIHVLLSMLAYSLLTLSLIHI